MGTVVARPPRRLRSDRAPLVPIHRDHPSGRVRRRSGVRAAAVPFAILMGLLLAGPLAFPAPLLAEEGNPEITSKELMAHVKYLADDDRAGRLPGTKEIREAADYIAAEYARIGLDPIGAEKSYFQEFTLPRGFKALPATSLVAERGRNTISFEFDEEIYPLPGAKGGKAEGLLFFAGYGISAPDLNYDDYEGVDVKGRVVMVLRGAPNGDKKNPFASNRMRNRYASFQAKMETAAAQGALALVVVNDSANHGTKSKDQLSRTGGRNQAQGRIPALHMTYHAGKRLASEGGLSLSKVQKIMDSRFEPRPKALDKVKVTLEAALEVNRLAVRNVVGLLRARGEDAKDEVVVVGAHYDHIGRGEYGSLGGPKAKGEIHNGADDNASGTAGVMEIAGFLAERAETLKRNVLFICFTAEELGLLGSKHYVDQPLIPLSKTCAMVNLDMVSYLSKTKKLELYGLGTSPLFDEILKAANRGGRIKVKEIDGVGRGASDHYPFYQKSLPVLFFITGLHKNYHRPEDDVKYLDKRGFEKVVRLAAEMTLDIATRDVRLPFSATEEGGLDNGPFLGVALQTVEQRIFISDVTRGSPAQKGGLKKGDQLLEVNDREIESLALFYGLWASVAEKSRPVFVVRRQGRTKTVRIRLG